jgi:hypothetical protein
MSYVTARVASNISTHGLRYAVTVEIDRFRRLGRSKEAAISCALAQVSAVLKETRK